jgi:ADP-L-glycero-D-manno-heptose 6-epimerase
LAEVINEIPRRLVEAHTMQASITRDGWHVGCKDLPDLYRKVLTACQLARHEVNIEIEILVIEFFRHLIADQGAELLKVDDKSSLGVGIPLHRNDELEIVTVPILICTGTEHLHIFLLGPGRIVQLVCCVEMFLTTDEYHLRGRTSAKYKLTCSQICSMIVVTGAAGFIGSCLVKRLNQDNFNAIIAVDKFDSAAKNRNLEGARIQEKVDRDEFFRWLETNHELVEFIFHIGARTDTTEFNKEIFDRLNVAYSRQVWKCCVEFQIPLVYASSAATYGLGEHGYDDDDRTESLKKLRPLNPYGWSKLEFDIWATEQEKKPFYWVGLKFFNVYGPNEYHKGRMASVIWHAYQQILASGKMKLFRSHRNDYGDGKQMRDFVYVKDVIEVCMHLMHNRKQSGIYNLGSGKARTFLDLAHAVFASMGQPAVIEFIDTPADIRDKYQYFTEAKMDKLRSVGYSKPFHTLEEGVQDYVANHLKRQ